MKRSIALIYHTDPGHGWLEVPVALVDELDITVSPYSYQRGGDVFLEEDLDMSAFLNAARSAGWDVRYYTEHTNASHWIRTCASYSRAWGRGGS
jgi:hypothetical protein